MTLAFSGLKSSVINYKHNLAQKGEAVNPSHVAAGFQASVVEVLTTKALKVAKEFGVETGNCGWRSSGE